MSVPEAIARGAYGLRWAGVDSADLPADAPGDWPLVTVTTRVGEPVLTAASFGGQKAEIEIAPRCDLYLDREAGSAEYVAPDELTSDELIHPYLAKSASVFAVWTGRAAIHAGAFVHRGRAWGVLGAREAGKSTLLARLATRGVPVVADDLLVITPDLTVAMGPRCIDLRPATVERLGSGTTIPSRRGSRGRLPLPPIEPATPLGGWVVLDWGERAAVEPLRASDRLGNLIARRMYGLTPAAGAGMLLDLTTLPSLRLTRPCEWGSEPAAIDLLLSALPPA